MGCGCKPQAEEPHTCRWEPDQPGDPSVLGAGKPGAELWELGLRTPGLQELPRHGLGVTQQAGTLWVHTSLCPRRGDGRYLGRGTHV